MEQQGYLHHTPAVLISLCRSHYSQLTDVLLTCLPPLMQTNEDSQESVTPLPLHDNMGCFLPDSSSYELLAVIGRFLQKLKGGHRICEEPPGTDTPCFPPRAWSGRPDDGEPGPLPAQWRARGHTPH